MTYQEFFKLLGNPDPICLIDNKIKISVNEINKYNKLNPEGIKEKQRLSIVAFEAANRWTDNIFNLNIFIPIKK